MAPPRRILRQQQKILLDFLEANKDLHRCTREEIKQKWIDVTKKLNSVPSGTLKTPHLWRRYWIEWRHKCRKKGADTRRSASGGASNRVIPLDEVEIRALELSGKSYIVNTTGSSENMDSFVGEDSDSEPLDNVKHNEDSDSEPLKNVKLQFSTTNGKVKRSIRNSRTSTDNGESSSPPPKWALDLEKRRIAAEERMATSLETIANLIKAQEERRSILEERMTDALTAIAGTLQDLNSGVQEAVHHLQQVHPIKTNDRNIKDEFL
ncbi:uncharacterized protein LOC128671773 isoform X2 [Plodia interpunctella]|nr:uncharacterized protein LOC128671773 isoform X2 [Plodia interpunctella]XP_053604521.1 uncharacterized protein LOC128671773 isoform X2 [Plodia interpunctella]